MDGEIALRYLQRFDEATKDQADGDYRLLVFDGHSTHLSFEFIEYALDNKIILLCYPPHTLHALQGWDVVICGRLKENWVEAHDDFSSSNRQTIGKHNFLCIFAVALQQTF